MKQFFTHICLTAFHYFVMCSIGWWWVLGADFSLMKVAALSVLSGIGAACNVLIYNAINRKSVGGCAK